MAELLLVPEVAAGALDVVIAEWLLQPGAAVSEGDVIAVIETDKALVELAAERDCTFLRPLVAAGAQVGVGLPMALLGTPEEFDEDPDELLSALGYVTAAPGTPVPALSDDETPTSDGATRAASEPSGGVRDETSARVFASPLARKLLRQAGLTPAHVSGTGPRGRIRRRDVEAAIATRSTERADRLAATGPTPEPRWTDHPHSRLRRAIARRLTDSKREVPHFYIKRSVQVDALLELRAKLNEESSIKISVNDMLIKAMATAHHRVPAANVIWTDDAVRQYESVDIAVAIDSSRGLVTPVLRNLDRCTLAAISQQVRTMAAKADAGTLTQDDLEGGSTTISNLGMFEVDEFAAIINPPHSAILAVGRARQAPVVEDGSVECRSVVELVLSVDHRAVDGALAARWMSALADAVQRPHSLVL